MTAIENMDLNLLEVRFMMIINIVPDIPLEKDSDDYKELNNIFSYIIDCATEIQVACKLIEKKDSIFNERASKMYLRRFSINGIILNVYRVNELLQRDGCFSKYFLRYKKDIDSILSKYKEGIENYRNSYLAHSKKKGKNGTGITTPQERYDMVYKAIKDEDDFLNDIINLNSLLLSLAKYFDFIKYPAADS